MNIPVLKDGDIRPTGQHFRLSWEHLEKLMQGELRPLMHPSERIVAIVKQDDHGVVVCIGESNEESM